MSMPPRATAHQVEGSIAKRVSIATAPLFPGDAADGTADVGDSDSARIEGVRHGWRVLGILSARPLLAYAGAGGFFYGGIFAYIAGTPFAYLTYHHVPPQLYGLLFGIAVVGIMASNLANSRLVTRFGSNRLLVRGTDVAALAGIMLAVAAGTGWGGLAG